MNSRKNGNKQPLGNPRIAELGVARNSSPAKAETLAADLAGHRMQTRIGKWLNSRSATYAFCRTIRSLGQPRRVSRDKL
jgi:hypothetical protein